MKSPYYSLAFAIAAFAFLNCQLPVSKTLSKSKVGKVAIGMDPNEVYSLVGKENITILDLFLEAVYSPALILKTPTNKQAVAFELVCDKIHRMTVYDAEFKTDKGICVGSTMGELKSKYKVSSIEVGEVGVFAYVEELNMSFQLLNIKSLSDPPRVEDIGDDVHIGRILVL